MLERLNLNRSDYCWDVPNRSLRRFGGRMNHAGRITSCWSWGDCSATRRNQRYAVYGRRHVKGCRLAQSTAWQNKLLHDSSLGPRDVTEVTSASRICKSGNRCGSRHRNAFGWQSGRLVNGPLIFIIASWASFITLRRNGRRFRQHALRIRNFCKITDDRHLTTTS